VLATGAYGAQIVAVRGTYDDVNRLCTEVFGRAGPNWAFVKRQPAPRYYAEGSKTLAFETIEQLGWELPDRVRGADRLGLAVHQGFRARGFRRVHRRRAGLRQHARSWNGGAGTRLFAGRDPRSRRGHDHRAPRSSPTRSPKSLAIGNPADGPYAIELARRTGGAIDSVTDDEIRAGNPAARQDDRHLHRDGPAGVTIATLKKLARARRHRAPTSAWWRWSPGDGLEDPLTRSAARFEVTEIPASLDGVRRAVRPRGGRRMTRAARSAMPSGGETRPGARSPRHDER